MSVCFAGECCVCVSAMVHCHNEPPGNLAHRAHGPAAARIPTQDPHQDHKGEQRRLSQILTNTVHRQQEAKLS